MLFPANNAMTRGKVIIRIIVLGIAEVLSPLHESLSPPSLPVPQTEQNQLVDFWSEAGRTKTHPSWSNVEGIVGT